MGPDVNESFYKFSVNKKGEIRFGLGAVKGVGEGAVDAIVVERNKQGLYKSFSDFMKRIDLRSANKRTIESIAYSGGFDSFNYKRYDYFSKDEKGITYIEQMIKFGNRIQDSLNSSQVDMFGDSVEISIKVPEPFETEEWTTMQQLSYEKEVVGIYLCLVIR